MSKFDELMKMNHVQNTAPITKTKSETITLTREDFNLLDAEENVTYNILEEDGSITIKKGTNR